MYLSCQKRAAAHYPASPSGLARCVQLLARPAASTAACEGAVLVLHWGLWGNALQCSTIVVPAFGNK